MYADYNYYTNSFAGTLIPAEEFASLSMKAERYLDYVTQHRIEAVNDEIRNAVCAASEALHTFHSQYAEIPAGIKSESTDGHSVTYSELNAEEFIQREKALMYQAFEQELSGTGLLYRGVSGC